jgi:hypothetical protein
MITNKERKIAKFQFYYLMYAEMTIVIVIIIIFTIMAILGYDGIIKWMLGF